MLEENLERFLINTEQSQDTKSGREAKEKVVISTALLLHADNPNTLKSTRNHELL